MSNIVKHQATPIVANNLDDLKRLAQMCAESGFFQDARQLAQACVKIAAGAEYGLPPVVSMTGINVIKGRVTLSANTMAAIMKRAGYKLKTRFDGEQSCAITVIDPDGEELGVSSFSMDDARRAGLGGENWKKFPRNMLFARAVSNAARWFAPEVLTGAITPEELGENEEPPVVEVVEAEVVSETQQFRREIAALANTPAGREVMRIAAEKTEPADEAMPEPVDEDEELPLPPSSEIRQLNPRATQVKRIHARLREVGLDLNPRATQVKRIHARLREVGLDHDQLKALLPETWSFKTASESDLDCLESLIAARSTDELRHRWGFLVKNGLDGGLEKVKDHMKGRLA